MMNIWENIISNKNDIRIEDWTNFIVLKDPKDYGKNETLLNGQVEINKLSVRFYFENEAHVTQGTELTIDENDVWEIAIEDYLNQHDATREHVNEMIGNWDYFYDQKHITKALIQMANVEISEQAFADMFFDDRDINTVLKDLFRSFDPTRLAQELSTAN